MTQFRKKSVVIEARCFDLGESRQVDAPGTGSRGTALEQWCGGSIRGVVLPPEDRVLQIQTLEGEREARVGDWIIRSIKGEFYPCKADIFAESYDPVGECHSGRDGECGWKDCPQIRDGEPKKTGRSCPLYVWHDDD